MTQDHKPMINKRTEACNLRFRADLVILDKFCHLCADVYKWLHTLDMQISTENQMTTGSQEVISYILVFSMALRTYVLSFIGIIDDYIFVILKA